MSQISERSPKHCATKQGHKYFTKKLYLYLFTLFLTIFFLILLVWLILNPKNPKFSIIEAEITHLNLTSTNIPSRLNSSFIHLSLQSINPNKEASVYYDDLTLCISYNGLKIVPGISIRRFYQDRDVITNIPISASDQIQENIARSLAKDARLDQRTVLDFEVKGRLRWKIGNIITKRHSFRVNCAVVMTYGLKSSSLQGQREGIQCSTKV